MTAIFPPILSNTAISLKESFTPNAIPDYGKIYTKNDNNLYFQDGAGVEHSISLSDHTIAEMYMYESAESITIDTKDEYHLVSGFSTGIVQGWTFDTGSTGPIASFEDYSGTVAGTIKAIDVGHGLATEDNISITGTSAPNDYNGVYTITVIDNDSFYFTNAGWNATATATWTEGSYLEAGADSAGTYMVMYSITGDAGAASKEFKFELFLNSVEQNKTATEMMTSGTKHQSVSSGGFILIVAGDRIYIGMQNHTDTTAFALEHANLNLVKI